MKFKNAMKCHKCPESNHENGCPCWVELIETHVETGQERITRNCVFQLLPQLMVEVIKASNRPAAEIGGMRNDVVNAIGKLSHITLKHLPNQESVND